MPLFRLLKERVRDSPLEPLGRTLVRAARRRQNRTLEQQRNDAYDQLTHEVVRRVATPGGNCVDVGCHAGKVLEVIVDTAPDGEHHAFEPLPALAGRLRKRFPTVTVHELALADRSGMATFQHVVDRPAYSGLHRRPYPGDLAVQEIEVRIERMDDVLAPDYRIDFLKIDVEGGELDVLRGARQHIVASKPTIVFEYGNQSAAAYGGSMRLMHQFLTGCGLQVAHLDGRLEDAAPMTEDEFAATSGFMHIAFPGRRS